MPRRTGVCLAAFNAQFAVSGIRSADHQFPVRLDVCGVDECHSFVAGGFGTSMIDTVEPVANIDEHAMPGSSHDAALLCVLLQHRIVGGLTMDGFFE